MSPWNVIIGRGIYTVMKYDAFQWRMRYAERQSVAWRGLLRGDEEEGCGVASQFHGFNAKISPPQSTVGDYFLQVFIYVDVFFDWVMISGDLRRIEWL